MKKSDTIPTKAPYIDYSKRCMAGVRDRDDPEGEVKFQVLCYGMAYHELTSVDMGEGGELNMSGGARVRRRLDARGIDTNRFFCDLFTTAPVNDRWDDKGEGRRPDTSRSYLPPVIGD